MPVKVLDESSTSGVGLLRGVAGREEEKQILLDRDELCATCLGDASRRSEQVSSVVNKC